MFIEKKRQGKDVSVVRIAALAVEDALAQRETVLITLIYK